MSPLLIGVPSLKIVGLPDPNWLIFGTALGGLVTMTFDLPGIGVT